MNPLSGEIKRVPTINNSYQSCCAEFSWPELPLSEEATFKGVYLHIGEKALALATQQVLECIQAVDDLAPIFFAIWGKKWNRIEAMQLVAQEKDRQHRRDTPSLIKNASKAEKFVLAHFKRSLKEAKGSKEARRGLDEEELKTGTLLFGMAEAKSLLAEQVPVDAVQEIDESL